MCGIAGWVDYHRNIQYETNIMDKLVKTLEPRGPDAQGAWSSPECQIVHRRLIVVDPENGKQPMITTYGHKTYILTYNGELYNTEEIRQDLLKLGFTFNGHSDTEVLLKAYIAWKEECLERLNGIYAFGIWNDTDKVLFLARDRIGVKPLFFHKYDNGIVFGSEIKTLLAHPYITAKVDREGIAQILLLGPARKQGSGVFKDISELKPAQYAYLSKDGFSIKTYWSIKAQPHYENEHETAEHLRWLLEDAVTKQLVSDVPLCCFLSGGLDSSIISAIASEQYRKKGEVLNTFSVDYRGNREHFKSSAFQPDEDFPWIIKMSNFLKTYHTNVTLEIPQLSDALFPATLARDLPGMADVDSSLYLFCKETKKRFAVGLSGECSDESKHTGSQSCNIPYIKRVEKQTNQLVFPLFL
jgi:asparagine synthase (glutamine-hydrolysing)